MSTPAARSVRLWLLPGLLLGLLAGCGMYGQLYLEQAPATPEVTPAPPIAGEEEQEDDAEPENRRPEGEPGAAGGS